MATAAEMIEALALAPHPEGGWYRETWRADSPPGDRALATAILFLLDAGERSHWHRVDAAEIWLWHAGAPLTLSTAPSGAGPDEAGPVTAIVLGPDVMGGQAPQHVIAPGLWQAAEPVGGWTLVSCIVSPGFEFSGFELAAPDWAPKRD